MLLEYIAYGYNNAFRYPRRFLTIVIGVALSTFSILSMLSVTTNMHRLNEHLLFSLENSDVNYNQSYIQPQTFENPVTKTTLEQALSIKEVESGYYFEDFSYYIWQYEYLLPWFELKNNLNLELKSIFLDVSSAMDYGLNNKIIYGSYFSDDPNEIIISENVLNRFIHEVQVFKDGYIILPENIRSDLSDGEGESINPEDIIGQSITFTYNFDFELDTTNQEEPLYKMSNPKSIDLKVVGIFDPSQGFQTLGEAWIPLSLKEKLTGLDIDSLDSKMSGQIALKANDPSQVESIQQKVKDMGYYSILTLEGKPNITNEILQRNVHKFFYNLATISIIIVAIISLMIIGSLMISERKYDFTLQRAIGAAKKQIIILYAIEMFYISVIGVLFGLIFTLIFLQSGFDILVGFNFFLYGNITIMTITFIPIITLILSVIQLNNSFKKQTATGLAEGGI